jgi:hypothetical protein
MAAACVTEAAHRRNAARAPPPPAHRGPLRPAHRGAARSSSGPVRARAAAPACRTARGRAGRVVVGLARDHQFLDDARRGRANARTHCAARRLPRQPRRSTVQLLHGTRRGAERPRLEPVLAARSSSAAISSSTSATRAYPSPAASHLLTASGVTVRVDVPEAARASLSTSAVRGQRVVALQFAARQHVGEVARRPGARPRPAHCAAPVACSTAEIDQAEPGRPRRTPSASRRSSRSVAPSSPRARSRRSRPPAPARRPPPRGPRTGCAAAARSPPARARNATRRRFPGSTGRAQRPRMTVYTRLPCARSGTRGTAVHSAARPGRGARPSGPVSGVRQQLASACRQQGSMKQLAAAWRAPLSRACSRMRSKRVSSNAGAPKIRSYGVGRVSSFAAVMPAYYSPRGVRPVRRAGRGVGSATSGHAAQQRSGASAPAAPPHEHQVQGGRSSRRRLRDGENVTSAGSARGTRTE